MSAPFRIGIGTGVGISTCISNVWAHVDLGHHSWTARADRRSLDGFENIYMGANHWKETRMPRWQKKGIGLGTVDA